MQERICDRRRFNRRNSDSFKSCNRLKSFDQSHKIHVSLTVLPDIYPCQNNLSISAVSKQCGFLYHVFQQATSFTTSGERDETKTAHDVAAVLDLEQRSCGVRFAKSSRSIVLVWITSARTCFFNASGEGRNEGRSHLN